MEANPPRPNLQRGDPAFCVLSDEDLIVLHSGLCRGYRVRISGIADNFPRHTWLMGALLGDPAAGWLPGPRSDPRVVAARDQPVDPAADTVVGAFNLFHWPGLRPDGTLADTLDAHDLWIWGEGPPADIAPFAGTRVVLLGPAPYARAWNPDRRFPGLPGALEVQDILPPPEVAAWLTRLAQAPRPA